MPFIKNSNDFIEKVRELDEKLKSIRINSIEIDKEKQKVTYIFICSEYIGDDLRNKVLNVVTEMSHRAFREVSVIIKKIVSNDELINNAIYNYLNDNFPSIAIFLRPEDVTSSTIGDTVKYTLRLTQDGVEYLNKNKVFQQLNDYLSVNFCSDFAGNTQIKEMPDLSKLVKDEDFLSDFKRTERRTLKVEDVVIIDDENMGDIAEYIEDATSGEVTICGMITEIVEKQTKNNKPYFLIRLDDTTGKASGVYFTRKPTLEKIRELTQGSCIIARGSYSEYNGRESLTFYKINKCSFPKNFEKKEKYKNKPPKNYRLIFPQPATTMKVSSVFDDQSLPEELTNKTYVVFDLETTGLELMNNGITEIGAVKIVNGVIKEQFTTLINPDYIISEENTSITGITPEMVKDSPKISAVIPDFMKFIEGTILVAHNADFDCKFIKKFAGMEEFDVPNRVIDTMEMTRLYLPQLKRADLATLTEHFGIIFHHHRALSDAYATAEAFIELMKIKAKKA